MQNATTWYAEELCFQRTHSRKRLPVVFPSIDLFIQICGIKMWLNYYDLLNDGKTRQALWCQHTHRQHFAMLTNADEKTHAVTLMTLIIYELLWMLWHNVIKVGMDGKSVMKKAMLLAEWVSWNTTRWMFTLCLQLFIDSNLKYPHCIWTALKFLLGGGFKCSFRLCFSS